jgi:hypothetical protein
VQQQKVIVEMDSIGVVAKLNRAEQDWSVYGPLVETSSIYSISLATPRLMQFGGKQMVLRT